MKDIDEYLAWCEENDADAVGFMRQKLTKIRKEYGSDPTNEEIRWGREALQALYRVFLAAHEMPKKPEYCEILGEPLTRAQIASRLKALEQYNILVEQYINEQQLNDPTNDPDASLETQGLVVESTDSLLEIIIGGDGVTQDEAWVKELMKNMESDAGKR